MVESSILLAKNRRIKRLERSRFLLFVVAVVGWCLALSCALATRANAQNTCGQYPEIARHLLTKYEEKPVIQGVTDGSGSRLEILVSQDGTWTVLIINPNTNVACMVLSGDGWSLIPQGTGS